MQVDTTFRQMSMTKPVVAVAAMTRVEKGLIDPDAPVSQYLPEFYGFEDEGARPVTIRHLMTHIGGMGFGGLPWESTLLSGRMDAISAPDRPVRPGEAWAYSAADGPDMIARVVEVTSGQSYDQYVQSVMFAPLGMKDTGYCLRDEQRARLVGLCKARTGAISEGKSLLPDPKYPSGGSGLYSTVPDDLRLAQMLAGGGSLDGVRILPAEPVEEIRRAQLVPGLPGPQPGPGWDLLVRQVCDPAAAGSSLPENSYGWSGAYGTQFWVSPESELSAAWMMSLTSAGGAGDPEVFAFEAYIIGGCRTDPRYPLQ